MLPLEYQADRPCPQCRSEQYYYHLATDDGSVQERAYQCHDCGAERNEAVDLARTR